MSPRSEQSFTAYVGIDWADTKHDICVQAAGDTRRQFGCIAHRVAAIDEWANALHRRFGGPVAVAVELAKGPIVAALQKYDFLVLFPINPATLAKYRQAFWSGTHFVDAMNWLLRVIHGRSAGRLSRPRRRPAVGNSTLVML
jgi:hypothetical protein